MSALLKRAFATGHDFATAGGEQAAAVYGYHFEVTLISGTVLGPAYPEMEGDILALDPHGDSPVYVAPEAIAAIRIVMV